MKKNRSASALGKLGGMATLKKRGKSHFSRIGKMHRAKKAK